MAVLEAEYEVVTNSIVAILICFDERRHIFQKFVYPKRIQIVNVRRIVPAKYAEISDIFYINLARAYWWRVSYNLKEFENILNTKKISM